MYLKAHGRKNIYLGVYETSSFNSPLLPAVGGALEIINSMGGQVTVNNLVDQKAFIGAQTSVMIVPRNMNACIILERV